MIFLGHFLVMFLYHSVNNKPYYSLNLDTLFLSNNYNEIIIYQTQGEFDLINKTLNAKGGYLGWERIGVPISDRKVLLDSFELVNK